MRGMTVAMWCGVNEKPLELISGREYVRVICGDETQTGRLHRSEWEELIKFAKKLCLPKTLVVVGGWVKWGNKLEKFRSPLAEDSAHRRKIEFFLATYPHPLVSVEQVVRWPLKFRQQKTYNPDYWCEYTRRFIELTTSQANIVEYGEKWKMAIESGYPLAVFWWQGQDITETIKRFGWWQSSVIQDDKSISDFRPDKS